MVPHSLNIAYSDSGSQLLSKDSERVFRRGWRLDDNGKQRAVRSLFLLATTHPVQASIASRTNTD
jgi:hypothetical protein